MTIECNIGTFGNSYPSESWPQNNMGEGVGSICGQHVSSREKTDTL